MTTIAMPSRRIMERAQERSMATHETLEDAYASLDAQASSFCERERTLSLPSFSPAVGRTIQHNGFCEILFDITPHPLGGVVERVGPARGGRTDEYTSRWIRDGRVVSVSRG